MTAKFTSSLRRGRLRFLLWALTFLLMPQSLMADNKVTFTVTDSNVIGISSQEDYKHALNGVTNDKWCGSFNGQSEGCVYVEFNASELIKVSSYTLYTGNDVQYGRKNRNPKTWQLYARRNMDDEWTAISTVESGNLPTQNSEQSDPFNIEEEYATTFYKYFRYEFTAIENAEIFEIGEIVLNYTICPHNDAEEGSICTICGDKKVHRHNFNADDICTECGYKKPSLLPFVVIASKGGYDAEGPDKAIDGITTNKWCGDCSNGNPFIVLKPECKAKLDHYSLYTGNDITYNGYNRNPKEWKLYAKENDVDAWTEISHVTDAQLPTTASTQSDDYPIGEEFQDTYYKFFMFEIIKVGSGNIFEVGELCLMGNPCQHQYEGDSAICDICLEIKEHEHIYGEETIVISEPTCVTTGTEAYVCTRCKGLKTQMTPWLGHDYNDFIVTKAQTCTVTGEKEHTCKRCGYTDSEKIEPLGHTTIDDICTVCGHDVRTDRIIEYTATEKLRIIMDGIEGKEGEVAFDYTDKLPPLENPIGGYIDCEDWGEFLFGAHVIKHEYDEATHKGRIICDGPVWQFLDCTGLHPERLTSITLPNTVEYIEVWAFEQCNGLTSVTLLSDDPQETYYQLSFYGCNNLQEIIVPYSAYEDYVKVHGGEYHYKYDEDGTKHKVVYKDLFKSLLSLDDSKDFQTPTSEVKADVTLQRSFANDGWYSLCLPFSVSVADSPFSQVAEFNTLDGDTYRFTTVDNIEAGKAYIVKVNSAIANPTFQNVFITTETPVSYSDFVGIYSPTELGDGCKIIGSGTTVNTVTPGIMKGFRAYFKPSVAGSKAMRFTVDGDTATSISLPLREDQGGVSYNLQGQRVNASHRGIIIKNGKKYVR